MKISHQFEKFNESKKKIELQLTEWYTSLSLHLIPGLQSDVPQSAVCSVTYIVFYTDCIIINYLVQQIKPVTIYSTCNILRNNDGMSCEPS